MKRRSDARLGCALEVLGLVLLPAATAPAQSVLYVDDSAQPGGNGLNWDSAFNDLQDALFEAAGFNSPVEQIWVAAGIYRPSVPLLPSDSRTATFWLSLQLFPNGLTLYGGLAGNENPGTFNPDNRDFAMNETILSGDLAGNDSPGFYNMEENSYHVLLFDSFSQSEILLLDGFTITGGNANGPDNNNWPFPHNAGGGILFYGSFPSFFSGSLTEIRNCRIVANHSGFFNIGSANVSGFGAGIACLNSANPVVRDSLVQGNFAETWGWEKGDVAYGGGVYCSASAPTFVNCQFQQNEVFSDLFDDKGGGVACMNFALCAFGDCLLQSNSAMKGDSVYISADSFGEFGGVNLEGGAWEFCYEPSDPSSCALLGGIDVRGIQSFSNTYLSASGGMQLGGWLSGQNIIADQLTITSGTYKLSGELTGPGKLFLTSNAVLEAAGGIIGSNVVGTGDIQIDVDQELRVENGAIVELSGQEPVGSCAGGCVDPANNNWGTITVDGSLVVSNATVRNTNIDVTLAEFEGATDIINNDIRLLEASTGFGGQFFVAGSSTIECNTVVSEGDRYLDLDPDPSIPLAQRPVICNNRFSVIIKQGVDNTQGTLLELRSEDLNCNPDVDSNGCPSGAFELSGGDGFDVDINRWVLEQLEVLADAKLNLTDRQGFEFTTNGAPETVYVKELILHPDAVLNTALQRMYYQTLSMGTEDQIVDIPLLGFSLGIIAMEDETEFAVRVRKRLRDPEDSQPQNPPFKEGSITREEGLVPAASNNGVMDMRTRRLPDLGEPPPLSASSVAAKGAFARAGDENILVAFEYKFVEDPGGDAELIVYLSDEPDVGDNLVELARVRPPADNRPGSLGSSNGMAVFQGTFPRGQLNFTRGTYVELELHGQGARVWIDNWDPQIECLSCGDLNGTATLDNGDLLILLSEYGRDTVSHGGGDTAYCLDVGFNNDGYVDLGDLMAWDAILSGSLQVNNFCDTPFGAGRQAASTNGTVTLPPPDSLFVAGKSGIGGDQEDFLYTLDMTGTNGACIGQPQFPASSPGPGGHRGNGLLTRDSAGEVYQIHAIQGLIRLSDGAAVVPSATALPVQSDPAVTVTVGIAESGGGDYAGMPLGDAAFDPTDDSVVFVVPVLVSSSGFRYRAAAKLQLQGGGTYVVERLYGKNPHTYSTIEPVEDLGELIGFVYEPDRQRLREIEVDAEGKVYVTSAQEVGENDWVLVYDEALGNSSERAIDISDEVAGPTSLLVSTVDDKLYLSSSVNATSSGLTRVYRYSIDRGAGNAPDLTLDGHLAIDNPTTNGFNNCDNGPCGHVASVTSIQEDPNDGTLYVVGFTAPKVADDLPVNDPLYGELFGTESSMLATPTLAVIPASVNGPVLPGDSNPVPAAPIDCDTLSLPLSAVFVPGIGISGDCDGDGDVDAADYACFVNCLAGPAVIVASACASFDFDGDQDVDLRDFAAFTVIDASPVPGDCDHDGDVDAEDIGCFVGCLAGPNQDSAAGCASIDFDGDNDVDLADFAAFQAAFSGV